MILRKNLEGLEWLLFYMVSRRTRFAVSWRRAGMGLRLGVFVLAILSFALLVYFQQPDEETTLGGESLLVITLVNLNIVILCILAFLIGRNVTKLIFDRRRGILGSQLRTRLVVAFVGLALIPTSILFALASGLLTRALEGWFSERVEQSVGGAVEIAKLHFDGLRKNTERMTRLVVQEIELYLDHPRSKEELKEFLEAQRTQWDLFSITILQQNGIPLLEASHATSTLDEFREPAYESSALSDARKGKQRTLFEEKESLQFFRSYSKLSPREPPPLFESAPALLVVTNRIPPELSQLVSAVNDSFQGYQQLKLFKGPLKSNYFVMLALITALILFSAIWIAFYIARELVVPIQRLADATREVAKGRYDIRIREMGDDELGFLVKSFNQMTSDLQHSRSEIERRRIFIETILANLAVGIIALDEEGLITAVNPAATRICGFETGKNVRGVPLGDVLSREIMEQVSPLIDRALQDGEKDATSEDADEKLLTVLAQGRELKVVCTVGRIRDSQKLQQGLIVILDDVTELSKVQHMAAWREVAQRIAHEIKNPLTPLQLSAQRIVKLVQEARAQAGSAGPLVERISESAETIVEQVASIKRLANEFSNFARMPTADLKEAHLNEVVSSAIEPFAQNHAEILFQFIGEPDLPRVMIDVEQIRRIVMNLLDNAVAAMQAAGTPRGTARISVRTFYDRRERKVSLEISDNGPGIKPADKARIFEPYFSTKKGGTGLGLAIVTSIVADHQGSIRVYDNVPQGAKFLVDLPLHPARATQRKLGS